MNKSEISELKSIVARQQKEMEILKASQGAPQESLEPQQERISTEHLFLAVKRVCDDVIQTHYEQLPTMFADRQEFENFRKAAILDFLSANTFTDYKRSLEVRLKPIEEKLFNHFSLLTINRHSQKGEHDSKTHFNLDTILNFFKSNNNKWLMSILVFGTICLLAVYLICNITM